MIANRALRDFAHFFMKHNPEEKQFIRGFFLTQKRLSRFNWNPQLLRISDQIPEFYTITKSPLDSVTRSNDKTLLRKIFFEHVNSIEKPIVTDKNRIKSFVEYNRNDPFPLVDQDKLEAALNHFDRS